MFMLFFIYSYTLLDSPTGNYEIPGTHGTQVRVILGGMASGNFMI